MKSVFSACAALALTLYCMGPAVAQDHSHRPQYCGPNDPRCHEILEPDGRDRQMQRQPMHDRSRWNRDEWRGDPGRSGWSSQGVRRGDRVPLNYRSKQYVVDDWQSHGLRRPPRGYHWVQNGSDYLLVAMTTGIILDLLLNQ